MVEDIFAFNHIMNINIQLLTLCSKGIKQSHYPREEEQFEPNFNPCKVEPNIHAWSTDESLPSNRLPFIPVHGHGHSPPVTASPTLSVAVDCCNI